jgi:hypothetical protein
MREDLFGKPGLLGNGPQLLVNDFSSLVWLALPGLLSRVRHGTNCSLPPYLHVEKSRELSIYLKGIIPEKEG